MPNPIKYTTGSETNALKKGNFYIGTGSEGKGPSDVTGYYNGVTPQTGGYVIYMFKDGAPGNLSYHSAANDSELISFTSGLAGQTYTTVSQCFDYYAGQTDKVMIIQEFPSDYPLNYPNIVMPGLILNLDAGITQSYPGSGTTWTDINGLGPNKNGTLTNGPTFNSDNGGSIVFDGVDDEISFTSNTFGYSPGTTGEISLEIWIYPTGPYSSYINEPPTTNLGGFLGQSYFAGSIGWGLGMFRANSNNYFAFQVRHVGTIVQTGINSNHIFTDNSWYHVVGSFTRNDFSRVYINGVLASSTSSTPLNNISITPNQKTAKIGRINTFYAGCRIPVARIYNRPLSATEVLQNFNAQKGRFGL
jgi:hypothetical protein